MNETKFDKACRMYVAIGNADPIFVNRALEYKRGFSGKRLAMILAACLALTLVLTSALAVAFSFIGGGTSEPAVEYDNCLEAPGNAATVDKKDINLFDGRAKLVWRNSEGFHCVVIGSQYKYEKLVSTVGEGKKLSPEEADETSYRIWIVNGNGSVISPCLADNAGNVGYGELFDYEPEYEPADTFISLCEELLDVKGE